MGVGPSLGSRSAPRASYSVSWGVYAAALPTNPSCSTLTRTVAGDTNRDQRLLDPPPDVVFHADHVCECGDSGFCLAATSTGTLGSGVGENSRCRYSAALLFRRSLLGVQVNPSVSR